MPLQFDNQFVKRERVFQPLGSPVKQLYKPHILEDGSFELIEAGTSDLYAEIQSHAPSVDIHVILERFARGDMEALERVQGHYGDFTTLPTSYAELLNTVVQGESEFLSLPVETRAKFGHSFQQWLAAMDNMPDWLTRMGIDAAPSEAPVFEPSVPTPAPTPSQASVSSPGSPSPSSTDASVS